MHRWGKNRIHMSCDGDPTTTMEKLPSSWVRRRGGVAQGGSDVIGVLLEMTS